MKQVSVYDIIKKQNGESFAKTIRNYNNGIFEIPDIVNIVKYAGREAEPIMNYLVSLMNIQIKETKYEDPFVLLKKAGYNAYYADTLEKQNAISEYFKDGEKLCTFRDETRFKRYYIINAVKENVDDIKRETFKNPEREDEYGTSVISIQILKNGGFISIKNRYNHTVANPDNTFNSNPNNIIAGLSYSLKKYFDVDFSSVIAFLPDDYILISDKIIKYYYEINGYYFGDGFYAKNGKITEINKQTEVMLDHHILNFKNKTITPIMDDNDNHKDEAKVFQDELNEKKLQIVKNEDKTKSILLDGKEFVRLDQSRMTRLYLERALELPEYFLNHNRDLQYLVCPKVETVGNDVLIENNKMCYCNMINVKEIGNNFLPYAESLQEINLPNVKEIGNNFLSVNSEIKEINLPNVKDIGNDFLATNNKITSLNLPNVFYIGDDFMRNNTVLKSINLPNVKGIGDKFLYNNEELNELNIPEVIEIGNSFLAYNNKITSLNLPNVLYIGNDFLYTNSVLESLNLPNVKKIGSSCFHNIIKTILKEIYLPNIADINYDSFFNLIYSEEIEQLGNINDTYEIINRIKFYSDKKKIIDKIKFYSKGR